MDYGYARISTPKQSIERQIRNILRVSPNAIIFQEAYTGTTIIGRREWEKLEQLVKPHDRITFDSVSRMSRNAEEGFELCQKLYKEDITLTPTPHLLLKQHLI